MAVKCETNSNFSPFLPMKKPSKAMKREVIYFTPSFHSKWRSFHPISLFVSWAIFRHKHAFFYAGNSK